MVFVHNINPTIIKLGFLEIRWYGLMYALAFIITYYYLKTRSRKGKLNLTTEEIDSLMLWATLGLIIGARVFEVLFWNPTYYFTNPSKIIAVWEGGLSFHGGLAGVAIAVYVWIKKHKKKFLKLADNLAVPLSLGQALGRMGNFINGELYGRITTLPWGIRFPGAEGYRHPSQLYEVFYNLIIFGILFNLRNKNYRQGLLLALFLIFYSISRSVTDLFREYSFTIGQLTLSQLFNIPMIIMGIWLLYRKKDL